MSRRLLAVVAIVAWLLLVLAWGTGLRLGEPLHASQARALDGRGLTSIFGLAGQVEGGLRVVDLGPHAQGLQTWQLQTPLDADQLHLLHYHVEDFPRSLELALIFRTAADPEDVRSFTLPWPGKRGATLDLRSVPEWQGEITELGFSEYPAPGQAPPDMGFAPFVLTGARVETPSTIGRWQALTTHWMGWSAWSMRSINSNTANARVSGRGEPGLLLVLALGGAGLLAWAFGLLRVRGWQALLPAVLLAWLVLDLQWLSQLQRSHALTQTLFQGKAWPERSQVLGDRPLQQRAEAMREALARQPSGSRVLYWTPGSSDSARLGYFLRPYNVAPLPPGLDPDSLPDGSLLLINDGDLSWTWDSYRNRLSRGGYVIHGDLLWRDQDMLLLGVRQGAGS